MLHGTPLFSTMAAAFAAAWVLGMLARLLGLSPIVGYLFAGVLIGPWTPGFVGDSQVAAELAEIGVVLLMFGVGLHFHPRDLLKVKAIAIPGALLQSVVATLLGLVTGRAFGWTSSAALVLGIALAVASTVVLLRGLEDEGLLDTAGGHVAVGWLIVEDLLVVLVLVVIPSLGAGGETAPGGTLGAVGIAILKLGGLVALVVLAGARVVPWVLVRVAHLQSRELFTLTILALALSTAAAASFLFGASMALGAFLAGMLAGQSALSEQATADLLPLRDAFAVLFFVSVGMLFEPAFLIREPWLVLSALGIVLVGKPLAALAVVTAFGYSVRTALVVAVGLAQIGEFSFILADLALHQGLLPEAGRSLLVACALVSVAVNPFLFRGLSGLDGLARGRPLVARWLNAGGRGRAAIAQSRAAAAAGDPAPSLAVVVGYGPVGQAVERSLREVGVETTVVDRNPDTVSELAANGRLAICGDASRAEVLSRAGISRARHLVITLPHSENRTPMVAAARQLNPACRIFVRARYLREREGLWQVGADGACFEEAEAAVALTTRVLADLGTEAATVARLVDRVRSETTGERPESPRST